MRIITPLLPQPIAQQNEGGRTTINLPPATTNTPSPVPSRPLPPPHRLVPRGRGQELGLVLADGGEQGEHNGPDRRKLARELRQQLQRAGRTLPNTLPNLDESLPLGIFSSEWSGHRSILPKSSKPDRDWGRQSGERGQLLGGNGSGEVGSSKNWQEMGGEFRGRKMFGKHKPRTSVQPQKYVFARLLPSRCGVKDWQRVCLPPDLTCLWGRRALKGSRSAMRYGIANFRIRIGSNLMNHEGCDGRSPGQCHARRVGAYPIQAAGRNTEAGNGGASLTLTLTLTRRQMWTNQGLGRGEDLRGE